MTREDLFAAIGTVEISRLAKIEKGIEITRDDGLEEPSMKKTTIAVGRVLRNLLVAALIISLLAVTAYAVVGYVIYDNPEEMISSIFGNKTGFDSGEYTEIPDPERPGGLLAVQPEYERVEADSKVVQEDVAPYVSPVGRSITFKDMTLTMDSFLYDSGTKCGIVTYTLTNPPKYETQYDGQLFYDGIRNPVAFNQYGYSYIIQDKTTENTLAAAYYFQYDPEQKASEGMDQDFSVGLYLDADGLDPKTRSEQYMEEVKAQYTPEEAIEKVWEDAREHGTEERLQQDIGWFGEEGAAYRALRDMLLIERGAEIEANSTSPDRIPFDCSQSSGIENVTLGDSNVIVSPISMRVDARNLESLWDKNRVATVDEIVVFFADGTEYPVSGKNAGGGDVENWLFSVWSPVELAANQENVLLTVMFNRVIDLDQVAFVKINGTELKPD